MKSHTWETFHLRGLFLMMAVRGAVGVDGGWDDGVELGAVVAVGLLWLLPFVKGATLSFSVELVLLAVFCLFSGGSPPADFVFPFCSLEDLLFEPGGRPGPRFTGAVEFGGPAADLSSFSDFLLTGAENKKRM